jgi:hypothetical protein
MVGRDGKVYCGTIRYSPIQTAKLRESVGDVLLDLAIAARLTGESLLDTCDRLAVTAAMERAGGVQKHAAAILHISIRRMNYYCEDLRLRPIDKARKGVNMDGQEKRETGYEDR